MLLPIIMVPQPIIIHHEILAFTTVIHERLVLVLIKRLVNIFLVGDVELVGAGESGARATSFDGGALGFAGGGFGGFGAFF